MEKSFNENYKSIPRDTIQMYEMHGTGASERNKGYGDDFHQNRTINYVGENIHSRPESRRREVSMTPEQIRDRDERIRKSRDTASLRYSEYMASFEERPGDRRRRNQDCENRRQTRRTEIPRSADIMNTSEFFPENKNPRMIERSEEQRRLRDEREYCSPKRPIPERRFSDHSGEYQENARRVHKKKKNSYGKVVVIMLCCMLLLCGGLFAFGRVMGSNFLMAEGETTEPILKDSVLQDVVELLAASDPGVDLRQQSIDTAAFQSAQYDYDGAIETLKTIEGYENDSEVTSLIADNEAIKATCTAYPVDQITHVFFHSLLYQPEISFSEISPQPVGFNQYMTTLSEFNKILQSMYDRGYVLVSLYDVAAPGEDGVFQAGTIMLPPGKKAFVLSQDDVNYYHNYANGGIADKLVIDEATGKIKAQYTYQDGTVENGDFDVVPALDTFVEQHPDFSYHGAKGALAVTGYNGVLGYRTDITYATTEERDSHQQAWLDAHPEFNYEEECAQAAAVAQALKDDGWLLASHSWGHLWQDKQGSDGFAVDAQKWMERVYPIIGGTDIWIYPNGEDVDCDKWQDRFQLLLNYGFRYFCPVNSVQYSVRIDSYGLNMGRRNLDGYRMYYDMIDDSVDRLSDLFDVNEVYDPIRPPVEEI